ncbi:MAG: MFS transporter [Microcoleus sp. PH2017_10_PVI_O_A]|uniref:MFS transporter n=1 Tax=unclassified Microcoleus TaxID=2642155 RepID=UPI001D45F803|nr:MULTISPECIES: MFS transporter [unclassified Microcoleus]TAE76856.1 MAG: MFS transporter [Oscillatoriales cyanobacterium]MCC3408640.1 MFS transporter [Microcoleus sp. PH2017_10_PVI_O_A]MCC3462727.1 MFS transporter [Microcoleus sp. PH2017_11_PCY_U_A]MCC3481178.1 MFS transporter [Microcoleus sp. PH2017_12_PCY_D_A]MCC3562149.1 MFS transporter [Microcoleus sp. PH2017_27_LUM_O_A]
MNLQAKIKKIKLPPALRSQNYRLFFAGQGISLIGSWMTQVATVWLVYNLSDSPWMLGVVGFTSQIPTLILLPFAGVLIDRTNRHRVIITTQILAMIQSLALAFLALTGVINIWQILILSFCQGAINAFDAPARQAFVSELVEKKEDLANAIALNASMFNGARLIGPAIAGLVIGTVGPSYCFLLDGISYIAVIAGLLAMKIKPRKIAASNTKPLQRLKEGFDYAFGFPPIRAILLLLALVSFAGMSHTVLVPIFATKILNGGPQTLGFLMAASGVGAFAGAIYLIGRKSIVGIGKLIAISPAIMGFGLIGFGLSRILWLSLIMMLFVGFGFIIQFAGGNTFLQTIVEDDKRGRVMSIYTMAFFGVTPFGNLVAGGMANYIGSPNTVILGGIICILGSIIFTRQLPALKNLVRPIYQKMGLIS